MSIELSQNSVDLGKISIGEVPELPDIEARLERIEALKNQVEALKNPQTEGDVQRLGEAAAQLEAECIALKSIKLNVTPSSGQNNPPPVEVTVRSNPQDLLGEIEMTFTNIKARPTNPPDSLGTLSTTTGSTDFTAIFYPNGNYGTVTFRATVDGVVSDAVTLVITGQTKEEAQAELDKRVNALDAAKLYSIALNAACAAALTAGLLAVITLITLAVLGISVALAPIAAIIAAIAALVGLVYIAASIETAKKKLKENTQPIIELLPSGDD